MPRDAGGNYSLPAGNPVVSGTTIDSTWANDTMTDLSSEMQDSVSRSGKGPMLAALQLADGTLNAPSLTFASEPTTGVFRSQNNIIDFAMGGFIRQTWADSKIILYGQVDIPNAIFAPQIPVALGYIEADGSVSGVSIGIQSVTRTQSGFYTVLLDHNATVAEDFVCLTSSLLADEPITVGAEGTTGTTNSITVRMSLGTANYINTEFSLAVFDAGQFV